MKSLIATAALSLLALSTIAEAQPSKDQSIVAANLMASLPTQDLAPVMTVKSSLNIQSLLATLPMVDENVETPAYVNASQLMASLPTVDENVEVPAYANASQLMASLPTVDENAEAPAHRNVSQLMASLPTMDVNAELPAIPVNVAKLMASLPVMDQNTVTSILVDTNIHFLDAKNHQAAVRITEE